MRWILLIMLAVAMSPLVGCAMFKAETWDLNQYRDHRASDIDDRLSKEAPIVQNPF